MTVPSELFEGGLPLVGLAIDPLSWDSAEAVWEAIRAVPGGYGWVCLGQQVVEWPAPLDGPVLSAEIVGSDGTSLHVRRSDGGWRGWRYREEPTGDLVRFEQRVVGTLPGHDRPLVYAVYWALREEDDGIEVYRPYAARFTGWGNA